MDVLQNGLKEWCHQFTRKTGFGVTNAAIKGPPRFAYIEIQNVKQNEIAGLEQKLDGVTLKNLEISSPLSTVSTPVSTPQHSSEFAVPALKRGLSFDADEGPSKMAHN
jgi:hypothetical protein